MKYEIENEKNQQKVELMEIRLKILKLKIKSNQEKSRGREIKITKSNSKLCNNLKASNEPTLR